MKEKTHAPEISRTYSCVPGHPPGRGWCISRPESTRVPRGKANWCRKQPWWNVPCVLWDGEENTEMHRSWKDESWEKDNG